MKKKLQGLTLISLLFFLIILGLASVCLVKMMTREQQNVSANLLKMRAYYAATSALVLAKQQWQLAPFHCPSQLFHFGSTTQALAGFEVQISCSQEIKYPAENPTFHAIELKASASKGKKGEKDFVLQVVNEWVAMQK